MLFNFQTAAGSVLRRLVFLLPAIFGLTQAAQAQTDNLMIVKYVDWDSGSGMAVVIWNPTSAPINLANYELRLYGNGSTSATTTSALSGTLAPCATILVGNDEYRNTNCRNTVSGGNFAAFSPGVNGNDVIALTLSSGQIIDAVGRIGYDPGNNNSQKVSNVNDALYQNKLERTPGNLARYSLTSGQYNPNATNIANIWPNNQTTNVTGWVVSNSNCLTNSWISNPAAVNAGPDKGRGCKSLAPFFLSALSGTGLNNSLQWSGGKGTFSNPTSSVATYTPSPQDPFRIKLTLTLTSGCYQTGDEISLFNGDSTFYAAGLTFTPKNPQIGDTVTFTLYGQTGNPYNSGKFNFGDGTPTRSSWGISKHVYQKAGSFTVKVVPQIPATIMVCPFDTLTAKVIIPENPVSTAIIIPNIFTPNNDNLNDTYAPQLPPTSAYQLKVYNRWGLLIFESKDPKVLWDGKNTPDGVYFVQLQARLTSGELLNKKLPVTIVR